METGMKALSIIEDDDGRFMVVQSPGADEFLAREAIELLHRALASVVTIRPLSAEKYRVSEHLDGEEQ
jgi:hypothetical protein